jgi:DNA-binding LacI/PurR family transcriptional regulator
MVRITDVARHAGVSPSTVSYALSGKRPISEATRRRIHASIRQLGYRPHAGARALATSRTRVLALVTPLREGGDVTAAMRFAARVVTAARRHDHDVLLLTQEEGEEGLRRVADSAMVDGFVIVGTVPYNARLPLPRGLGRPCVLISPLPGATGPAVPVCVALPDPGDDGAWPEPPESPEPGDLAERCVALLMARLAPAPRAPQRDEGPAVG